MSTFRFRLVAFGLLAQIFVGGFWALRGFPIMTLGLVPFQPDARIPTFEQTAKEHIRRDWVNSRTNQGDGNAQRDKLRLDLMQAANAYKMAPCGDVTRKNLIEALSNYTMAWYDMTFCKPGVGGCSSSTDERLDSAAAAFKTPADAHAQEALSRAIGKGGISREDFPSTIRPHVFRWSGSPPAKPREACLLARRQ